uniref:Uncharacterized protein n=1 Tax=Siphoviridae sp. ctAUQ2 TaxID=2826182 RepID=A0A8S5N0C6_9CAUD|nr:MAG TPA: hypothetical protein [Siphoviridae sp. ctAUQ2]
MCFVSVPLYVIRYIYIYECFFVLTTYLPNNLHKLTIFVQISI